MDTIPCFVARHVRELYRDDISSNDMQRGDYMTKELPFAVVDENAVMLVIDISGYSKLTTELALTLGPSGASTLVSIINTCMKRLLGIIYKYGGDVIKFAGDSIAVCWSHFSKAHSLNNKTQAAAVDLLKAIQCSFEILEVFQNYSIDMPEPVDDRVVYRGKKSFLRVHCSMAFGQVAHLHFGVKGRRREYLVGGKAVGESAVSLDLAKSGEICFSTSIAKHLKAMGADLKTARLEHNGVFFVLGQALLHSVCKLKAIRDIAGLPPPSPTRNRTASTESRADEALGIYKEYVNESAVYLLDKGAAANDGNDVVDKINILRQVTVVFVKLKGFETDNAHLQPWKGQEMFELVLFTIRQYEGSLRQFNIDDKGGTALLVWGLPPFSHEKEPDFGVLAAINLRAQLTKILDDQFSIGITTGAVFAGAIGDLHRKDHCILGLCVNEAARLMCHELAHGTCLCDEKTYQATKERFEYADGHIINIKGRDSAIEVYVPINRHTSDTDFKGRLQFKETLYGREQELETLKKSIQRWNSSKATQIVSIVGESGQGKSALLKMALTQLMRKADVIPCVVNGSEVDKTTPYNASRSVLASLFAMLASRTHEESTPSRLTPVVEEMEDAKLESLSKWRDSYLSLPTLDVTDMTLEQSELSRNVVRFWNALGEGYQTLPLLNHIFGVKFPESRHTRNLAGDALHEAILQALISALDNVKLLNLRLAVCIDDIQWCDQYSWALFVKLAQSVGGLFMCLTTRPELEYTDEQSLTNLRQITGTRIDLANLSKDALSEFFLGRAQEAGFVVGEVDTQLVQEVYQQTNGNPFVSGVLIDALLRSSFVKQVQDKLVPIGRFQSSMDSIASVISSQFDRLDKTLQDVLKVASVIGLYFNVDELCGIYSQHFKRTSLNEHLMNVIREHDRFRFLLPANVATEAGGEIDETSTGYGFRHIVIQQSVYSSMLFEERQQMHESAVEFYRIHCSEPSNAPELLPQICYHLDKCIGNEELKFDYFEALFLIMAHEKQTSEAANLYEKLQVLLERHQQTMRISPDRLSVIGNAMGNIHMINLEYSDAFKCFTNAMNLTKLNAPQGPVKLYTYITAHTVRLMLGGYKPQIPRLGSQILPEEPTRLHKIYNKLILTMLNLPLNREILFYALIYVNNTRRAIVFRIMDAVTVANRCYEMSIELFRSARASIEGQESEDEVTYRAVAGIFHLIYARMWEAVSGFDVPLAHHKQTGKSSLESALTSTLLISTVWHMGAFDKIERLTTDFQALLRVRQMTEMHELYLASCMVLALTEKCQLQDAVPWKSQLVGILTRNATGDKRAILTQKVMLLRGSLSLLFYCIASYTQTAGGAWDKESFVVTLKSVVELTGHLTATDIQSITVGFQLLDMMALLLHSPVLQRKPELKAHLYAAVNNVTRLFSHSTLLVNDATHFLGKGLLALMRNEPQLALVAWQIAIRRPSIEECKLCRAILHEQIARCGTLITAVLVNPSKVSDDDAHIALGMYRDMGARFRFAELRKWLVVNSKSVTNDHSSRQVSVVV